MTQAQLIEKILAGEILALGEYRHSKKEMLEWRDKKTGRACAAPILRHTVECGDQTIALSERVPDDMKLEAVSWPWTKSQRVVLHIDEISRNLGLISARGKLEAFESVSVSSNGDSHAGRLDVTSAPSPGKSAQPVGGVAESRSKG